MAIFCAFSYHAQNEKKINFYFQMPEALYDASVWEGKTFDAFKACYKRAIQHSWTMRVLWESMTLPFQNAGRLAATEHCRYKQASSQRGGAGHPADLNPVCIWSAVTRSESEKNPTAAAPKRYWDLMIFLPFINTFLKRFLVCQVPKFKLPVYWRQFSVLITQTQKNCSRYSMTFFPRNHVHHRDINVFTWVISLEYIFVSSIVNLLLTLCSRTKVMEKCYLFQGK